MLINFYWLTFIFIMTVYLGLMTMTISIISLIVAIMSYSVSNKRNKLTKDSFNIARIKGETNKKFWVKTIDKFVKAHKDDLKLPRNLDLEDKAEYHRYLKKKYYLLLEMAYSGELQTDNVQEVIELLFHARLKQSYWKHKKEN